MLEIAARLATGTGTARLCWTSILGWRRSMSLDSGWVAVYAGKNTETRIRLFAREVGGGAAL